MDAEDSDFADLDEDHLRAVCLEIVDQRLTYVRREVDGIVGSSVKAVITSETATITASFQSNFDAAIAACKKDFEDFPKKMGQRIMAVVTPKLDKLRTEVMQRCDEIKADLMQTD